MPLSSPCKADYSASTLLSPEQFRAALWQEARGAVRSVLESAMREELTLLLQAEAYERSALRSGRRNGSYGRTLVSALGPLDLHVPRDREGHYHTQVFERYQRQQAEVTQLIGEMFFAGISQGQVGRVAEPLLGIKPSAASVSRIAHDLEGECQQWRQRPLQSHYRVIYLDGVYYPIQHEQQVDQTPLLLALGVDLRGQKEVLALEVAAQESADAWQALVEGLKQRGVQQVDLCVSDGDEGLIGVLERAFPTARRQRCITHKLRNVLAKIPKRAKRAVAEALKAIFAQPTRDQAQTQLEAFRLRYERIYPEAVATLLRDIDSCLTFYDFPPQLWKHVRTTNALEGLFHTVRQRTDKIGAFRNETSCVLIVYAVLRTVRFRRIPI